MKTLSTLITLLSKVLGPSKKEKILDEIGKAIYKEKYNEIPNNNSNNDTH